MPNQQPIKVRQTGPMAYELLEKTFWVDVPNPHPTSDDDSWINLATFGTRQDAEKYLLERYGLRPEQTDLFITEDPNA